MASPGRTLTAIGFRRELAIFLSIVVGFLVVIVLVLLILLQMMSNSYEQAVLDRRDTIADAAIDHLRSIEPSQISSDSFIYLRSTLGVDAVELRTADGEVIVSGDVVDAMQPVRRSFAGGTLILWFDANNLESNQRVFRRTAFVAFFATILATLMLALFLPRIVRPFAEMLEKAREIGPQEDASEETYLVETFRRTIDTLKQQEAELQRLHSIEKSRADELERIVSTLKRSLASGFLALDPDARVIEINDAGRSILGIPLNRTVSGDALESLRVDPALAASLGEAVASRRPILRDEITIGEAPRETAIGLTLVPLFDEADRFLGSIALFTDLTEIRRLERRLRETQTLADLGQIGAGIAHEFRNSLSTIRGYLRLAASEASNSPVGARIDSADREAAELSQAVDRLLAFARPMEPRWEMVDLLAVVDAVAQRLRETGAGGPIEIEADGPVEIQGDATLLSRALENLLRNALESNALAGRSNSRVLVRLAAQPVPTLEITDEGVGLGPEEAARVILPFQSTKAGGWGLGLPLARRILILHGAVFEIGPAEGGGARVRATFDRNPVVTQRHELTQKVSS